MSTPGQSWEGIEGRRVLREYETKQEMLDDVWEAHQRGWLPIKMTESRRGHKHLLPWKRMSKILYVVSYYQNVESQTPNATSV
jgi:hypothetical protein